MLNFKTLLRNTLVCASLLLANGASANILYDFSWDSSTANSSASLYEVAGTLTLNSGVSIGSLFSTVDVLSVFLNVTVDGVFEGTAAFPNTSTTNFFAGTRLADSLSFTDFFVDNVSGTTFGFGCSNVSCESAIVHIPRVSGGFDSLSYVSQAQAQASFTAQAAAVPVPATVMLIGIGLLGLSMRRKD